jgi:hypothetical protein
MPNNNTIQTGAKPESSKNYQAFGYWLNGIDVTRQNLDKFTPYVQGISRIFVYNKPVFMNEVFPTLTDDFTTAIESGFTRISGLSDITVQFIDFEGGFASQKFSTPSLATDDTESVTISIYEQSGSPMREYIETWISGVRDPRTGVAHYHGAIRDGGVTKSGQALAYTDKNHTMECFYATLDPTAVNLEYGCMFAYMFPTRVTKSHYDFEKGNRAEVLLDLEFRTMKYESPAINYICRWYVVSSNIEYSYLKFRPEFSTNGHTPTDYGTKNNIVGSQSNDNNITGVKF